MEHMFRLFQQMNQNTQNSESSELKVAEKLTYQNYTKWCKLIYIAIEGRGRLNHITAAPPEPSDSTYSQRKQRDSIFFSWIIVNIESNLVNQFLDYTTAWDLWKGIETLLNSGRDELQIFNLSTKVATLK